MLVVVASEGLEVSWLLVDVMSILPHRFNKNGAELESKGFSLKADLHTPKLSSVISNLEPRWATKSILNPAILNSLM